MTPSHPAALSVTGVTACRKEADGAGISFTGSPPRGPTIRADFLSAQVAPWSQVTTRVSHGGRTPDDEEAPADGETVAKNVFHFIETNAEDFTAVSRGPI